jgi:hypothetical protein
MLKNMNVKNQLKLPEDMPSALCTTRKKSLLKAMPESMLKNMPMNYEEACKKALMDAGLTKCFSHIAWRPPDKL